MNFQIEFQYPWVASLFAILAVAVYLYLRKKSPSVSFPSLRLLPHGTPTISMARWLPLIFYVCASALIIFALMGPRFDEGEIQQKFRGLDIILGIDLSGSMQAYDVPKKFRTDAEIRRAFSDKQIKQRIDACKDAIREFIAKRPNDRIGLIAFAEQAFAVCPPTLDHAWLDKQLASLSLNSIGEGTGIAAPIASAVERMKSSDAKRKIMVLFTDGENTVTNKITPLQAAKIAKSFDVTIHTVGIGANHSFIEQNMFGSKQLMRYPSHFDEKLMKEIANLTDGKYYQADDQESMNVVLDEINKLETQEEEIPRIVLYKEISSEVAGIALLTLLFGFLLSHTICLRYP